MFGPPPQPNNATQPNKNNATQTPVQHKMGALSPAMDFLNLHNNNIDGTDSKTLSSSSPSSPSSPSASCQPSTMASSSSSECCVICLDNISSPCTLQPCSHTNFDFTCLANWLNYNPTCPLCKATILDVSYTETDLATNQIHTRVYAVPVPEDTPYQAPLPSPHEDLLDTRNILSLFSGEEIAMMDIASRGPPLSQWSDPANTANQSARARRHRRAADQHQRQAQPRDEAIRRRRRVYRRELYSLHVGSNRYSGWRPLPTPAWLAARPRMVERARMWMRRELDVFTFLQQPDGHDDGGDRDVGIGGSSRAPGQSQQQQSRGEAARGSGWWGPRRRLNKAGVVLEQMTAVLKTVDLQDSAGTAETLLADFLGRAHARLFLHELRSWLRCPYGTLQEWDRRMQYPAESGEAAAAAAAGVRLPRSSERGSQSSFLQRRVDDDETLLCINSGSMLGVEVEQIVQRETRSLYDLIGALG